MLPKTAGPSKVNRDEFEEIEYSSCRSSNGQNSLLEQSTANLNETKEQQVELVYKFDLAKREQIFVNLNRYTQLFCSETSDSAAVDKLWADSKELFQFLTTLRLKSNSSAGGPAAGKMVLDLDFQTRLQIVSTLFANHSLAVDRESASLTSKMKMVEQNSELIARLAKLPISVCPGPTNGSGSSGKCIEILSI